MAGIVLVLNTKCVPFDYIISMHCHNNKTVILFCKDKNINLIKNLEKCYNFFLALEVKVRLMVKIPICENLAIQAQAMLKVKHG